jgi:hypothetical protein
VSTRWLSKKTVGSFSRRRHVNRKILRFSIIVGVAGAFLSAVAFLASAYPFVLDARDNNLQALSEIKCTEKTCDTSAYLADWQGTDPDYLVDTKNGF